MILVDMSQISLASMMMHLNMNKTTKPDEAMVRHMILNSLRMYRMRFKEEYGELILCFDSRHYWRRDHFPNYKAGRKKSREDSNLDWDAIFSCLNDIKQELKDYFPYKHLEVYGAEADDIIASVVFHVASEPKNYEKVLILSGDKDFIQLQKHKFVSQYSPIQKKYMNGIDPTTYIKTHILQGDRSDGVPNFLSPDNTFVDELRQKPISKRKLETWIDLEPEDFCNENMMRNYHRNRTLIDLDYIAKEIVDLCIKTFIDCLLYTSDAADE